MDKDAWLDDEDRNIPILIDLANDDQPNPISPTPTNKRLPAKAAAAAKRQPKKNQQQQHQQQRQEDVPMRVTGCDVGLRKLAFATVDGVDGRLTGEERLLAWEVIDLEVDGRGELALSDAVSTAVEKRPFLTKGVDCIGVEKQPAAFKFKGGNRMMQKVSMVVGEGLAHAADIEMHTGQRSEPAILHYPSAAVLKTVLDASGQLENVPAEWKDRLLATDPSDAVDLGAKKKKKKNEDDENREENKKRNWEAVRRWVYANQRKFPGLLSHWRSFGDGQRDAADALLHAFAMLKKGRKEFSKAADAARKRAMAKTPKENNNSSKKKKNQQPRPVGIGTPGVVKAWLAPADHIQIVRSFASQYEDVQ